MLCIRYHDIVFLHRFSNFIKLLPPASLFPRVVTFLNNSQQNPQNFQIQTLTYISRRLSPVISHGWSAACTSVGVSRFVSRSAVSQILCLADIDRQQGRWVLSSASEPFR